MKDRESQSLPELPPGFTINTFATTSAVTENSRSATPLAGKSLEDLLLRYPPEEVPQKIWTFDVVVGNVNVKGENISVESQPFNRSGIVYPDGIVYSLEDALILLDGPEHTTLRQNFGSNSWTHLVQTRYGSFFPFHQTHGDRIIQMEKLRRGKNLPPTQK